MEIDYVDAPSDAAQGDFQFPAVMERNQSPLTPQPHDNQVPVDPLDVTRSTIPEIVENKIQTSESGLQSEIESTGAVDAPTATSQTNDEVPASISEGSSRSVVEHSMDESGPTSGGSENRFCAPTASKSPDPHLDQNKQAVSIQSVSTTRADDGRTGKELSDLLSSTGRRNEIPMSSTSTNSNQYSATKVPDQPSDDVVNSSNDMLDTLMKVFSKVDDGSSASNVLSLAASSSGAGGGRRHSDSQQSDFANPNGNTTNEFADNDDGDDESHPQSSEPAAVGLLPDGESLELLIIKKVAATSFFHLQRIVPVPIRFNFLPGDADPNNSMTISRFSLFKKPHRDRLIQIFCTYNGQELPIQILVTNLIKELPNYDPSAGRPTVSPASVMTYGSLNGVLGWHALSRWLPWSVQCGRSSFTPGSFSTVNVRPESSTQVFRAPRDKKRTRPNEPLIANEAPNDGDADADQEAQDDAPLGERPAKRQKTSATLEFLQSNIDTLNSFCPIPVKIHSLSGHKQNVSLKSFCAIDSAGPTRKIGFIWLKDGVEYSERELESKYNTRVSPSLVRVYTRKRGETRWFRLTEILSKDMLAGLQSVPARVFKLATPPRAERQKDLMEVDTPSRAELQNDHMEVDTQDEASRTTDEQEQVIKFNIEALQALCPIYASLFVHRLKIVKFYKVDKADLLGRRHRISFECESLKEPGVTFLRFDAKEKLSVHGNAPKVFNGAERLDTSFEPMIPDTTQNVEESCPPAASLSSAYRAAPLSKSPDSRRVSQSVSTLPAPTVVECDCSLGLPDALPRIVEKEKALSDMMRNFRRPNSVFDGTYVNLFIAAQHCDLHSSSVQSRLFPNTLAQSLGAGTTSIQQCRRILDQILASRSSAKSFLLFRSEEEPDAARKTALLRCIELSSAISSEQPLNDQWRSLWALLFEDWEGALVLAELLQEDKLWKSHCKYRCRRCGGHFPKATFCLLCSEMPEVL